MNLPVVAFSFCFGIFCIRKKWDCSLNCGLPCVSRPAVCDARARRSDAPPSNPDLYKIRSSSTHGSARHLAAARLPRLPVLQKISLRRRESRLAARALPSAVKSIFRRPRSAAFRRHPPYSCLEYGSDDYIIFAPARRRGAPPSNPDLYKIRSSSTNGSARHLAAARLPPKKGTITLNLSPRPVPGKILS